MTQTRLAVTIERGIALFPHRYRGFRDVVTVDMSVRECSGLDSVHGNFRVGFELSLRWYDQAFDR